MGCRAQPSWGIKTNVRPMAPGSIGVLNFESEPGLKSKIFGMSPLCLLQPRKRGVSEHDRGVPCSARETALDPAQPMALTVSRAPNISLDQAGCGAMERAHLKSLNRTFPASYFPGSRLSAGNHCLGPLGQSFTCRPRHPAKKGVLKPNQRQR